MILKCIFLLIIVISLSSCTEVFARQVKDEPAEDSVSIEKPACQQSDISNSLWEPCTSPFIELLGKGFFSLNVDFRKIEKRAISFGIAGIEEGVSPNVMGYFFSGRKHRLETGGGISGNIMGGNVINIIVHGVFGYRYQEKKGLLFRAGFTPMFVIPFTDEGTYAFIPWVGISLGYSF